MVLSVASVFFSFDSSRAILEAISLSGVADRIGALPLDDATLYEGRAILNEETVAGDDAADSDGEGV